MIKIGNYEFKDFTLYTDEKIDAAREINYYAKLINKTEIIAQKIALTSGMMENSEQTDQILKTYAADKELDNTRKKLEQLSEIAEKKESKVKKAKQEKECLEGEELEAKTKEIQKLNQELIKTKESLKRFTKLYNKNQAKNEKRGKELIDSDKAMDKIKEVVTSASNIDPEEEREIKKLESLISSSFKTCLKYICNCLDAPINYEAISYNEITGQRNSGGGFNKEKILSNRELTSLLAYVAREEQNNINGEVFQTGQ